MMDILMFSSVKVKLSEDKKFIVAISQKGNKIERSIENTRAIILMGASRFSDEFLSQIERRGLFLILVNGNISLIINEHNLPSLSTFLECEKNFIKKRNDIAFEITNAYLNNATKSIYQSFKIAIEKPDISEIREPEKLFQIIKEFEEKTYFPTISKRLGIQNPEKYIIPVRKIFIYRTLAYLLINRLWPSYSIITPKEYKIPLAYDISLELLPIACDELTFKLLETNKRKLPPRQVVIDFMMRHLATEFFHKSLDKHMHLSEIQEYQISLLKDTFLKGPVKYEAFIL